MFQIGTHQTITMENLSTVDFHSASLSVVDSKSNDRVTITGLAPDAVSREVSYFVRSQRYAHNNEARETAKTFLTSLLENCTEGLKYLAEQEAKAS